MLGHFLCPWSVLKPLITCFLNNLREERRHIYIYHVYQGPVWLVNYASELRAWLQNCYKSACPSISLTEAAYEQGRIWLWNAYHGISKLVLFPGGDSYFPLHLKAGAAGSHLYLNISDLGEVSCMRNSFILDQEKELGIALHQLPCHIFLSRWPLRKESFKENWLYLANEDLSQSCYLKQAYRRQEIQHTEIIVV